MVVHMDLLGLRMQDIAGAPEVKVVVVVSFEGSMTTPLRRCGRGRSKTIYCRLEEQKYELACPWCRLANIVSYNSQTFMYTMCCMQ